MNYTIKKQEKSTVLLTITVPTDEYSADVKQAAKRIAKKMTIKGFRKGKAPIDVVKREVGEMHILQEALETIIGRTFVEAVKEEKLETIGSPQVNFEKLAPANDIIYTAEIALLPKVTLTDIKKLKIKKGTGEVTEAALEETLKALRGMHAEEKPKKGKATGTDKLIMNMDMKIDNVRIEGGQAKNNQIYLSEKHYIPGFNEEVK